MAFSSSIRHRIRLRVRPLRGGYCRSSVDVVCQVENELVHLIVAAHTPPGGELERRAPMSARLELMAVRDCD